MIAKMLPLQHGVYKKNAKMNQLLEFIWSLCFFSLWYTFINIAILLVNEPIAGLSVS